MISALDSKVMDANSEALGVGVETLMDNAGKAVAGLLEERFPGKKIVIFCGHGNNGGDGAAAACHLDKGKVTLCLLGKPEDIKSHEAAAYYAKAQCQKVSFDEISGKYDVLVDAVLGTGIKGKLKPEYSDYIDYTRRFKGTIVSVDVPTGMGADKQVQPDITVTMHDAKKGMDEKTCGEIVVADIGIPEKAWTHTGPGDMLRYPRPDADSHKGANGRLLVIGGGPFYGAPAMSSMAAMRTGVDLVTVAVPEACWHEVAAISPVLMVHPLKGKVLRHEHVKELLELADANDAVLIGPGLGRDPATSEAVKEFTSLCQKPLVIDADGLNALGNDFRARNPETVLTPHRMEFMRLTGADGSAETAAEWAKKMGAVIVLKGKDDIISDGERLEYNSTGTVGMTTGGTGDVLAGIIGGLLAKGMDAYGAGYLGAYISGKAGELAFAKLSYGMIATDVIKYIPKAIGNGLDRLRV
jgi:NAD(P)H-hydrate epimerase